MEHTSHQWPQGVGFVDSSGTDKPVMESNDSGNYNQNKNKKMGRPSKDQAALNCPRCNSLNTKFCYYNNYSLSQPRYFCKTCRRYWTQGGSLRNVPVGGGSRKNKRPSSSIIPPPPPPPQSSSASENYMKLFPQITFPVAHDLNLSYPQMPTSASAFGAGSTNANVASKGLSLTMVGANFMQDLGFSPGGFHSTLPEFKPATTSSSSLLNFSLAHIDSNSDKGAFDINGLRGSFQLGLHEGEARVLFPTSNPKQATPSNNRAASADGGQQFQLNKGLLGGGEADGSGSEFWNHGLLVGGSTSWIHGTQMH